MKSPSLVEAEDQLIAFLQECAQKPAGARGDDATSSGDRVRCHLCNASRSLYCPDCYQILIPKEHWPAVIKNGSLKIPFAVDIILDDRQKASTGVQVATILSASRANATHSPSPRSRLIDREVFENIISYETEFDEPNTFLLFPGGNSKPLSSVARTRTIDRLIVLDCRWNHSSVRLHPYLRNFQRVHLDSSFKQSYYWRWHSAGEGMISTVEAIYLSAWEVALAKGWDALERKRLVYLLWLFGLQREHIRRKYEQCGGTRLAIHLPFTEDGKERQREMRRRPPPDCESAEGSQQFSRTY